MSGKLFNVGKVVNTHGIRGELKVVSQTDFPEERFGKGSRLVLTEPNDESRQLRVEVENARLHKNVYIVKFKGYDNINEVLPYKGWMLKVSEEDRKPLDEGEYYYHEIIGCRVVTDEGQELGTISDILAPGANHVWVVDRPKQKPVLLPVIDDVILDVNVEAKQVRVHLMEGLVD
ncbi:ribosome maturation factor RimM [Paenibacillus flagellatus]|uniref:Ribosome maturation factor RimM n=1 Tax=Paenibacillus flagellatus TaxID=2211139 RepID=A0A2V5K4T0_9BACL|nr:ribosome maturation factor RimM [Paenibacillus flagellatus]PYI54218.1 ribosome maturation factor RimM [Paenibacillus flagellatus]